VPVTETAAMFTPKYSSHRHTCADQTLMSADPTCAQSLQRPWH